MSMTQRQRQALIEQIERAFANVPYPGDDKILEMEISEAPEIRRDVVGRHWRQIDPGIGTDNRMHWPPETLLFVSPEACRFYLPAYMISCARDIIRADVIPDTLIFVLHPPNETTSPDATALTKDRFERVVGVMSDGEKEAVRAFLVYLFQVAPELELTSVDEQSDAMLRALRKYWNLERAG